MDTRYMNASSIIDSEKEILRDGTPEKSGRWYGKVVDIKDPFRLGRVKVSIFGHYDGIEKTKLPWAFPLSHFNGSKNGDFIIPELNTIVSGYFDDNDEMKPIYDGLIRTSESSSDSSTNTDRLLNYGDLHILYENDHGETVSVNKKNGEMKIQHRSGLIISIANDGTLNCSIVGDAKLDITGNAKINSSGTVDVIGLGDVNVDGETVNLGKSPSQLVNNLPACLICGSPHAVGNTNVKA